MHHWGASSEQLAGVASVCMAEHGHVRDISNGLLVVMGDGYSIIVNIVIHLAEAAAFDHNYLMEIVMEFV